MASEGAYFSKKKKATKKQKVEKLFLIVLVKIKKEKSLHVLSAKLMAS